MAEDLGFEQLAEEFDKEAKSAAIDSIYEVLTKRSKQLQSYLNRATPVLTGKLKGSIVRVLVEKSELRVSIRIKFDGYNPDGTAYQTIANALNKGYFNSKGAYITKHIHFIDNGISLLRGMDKDIAELFEVKIGGTTRG